MRETRKHVKPDGTPDIAAAMKQFDPAEADFETVEKSIRRQGERVDPAKPARDSKDKDAA